MDCKCFDRLTRAASSLLSRRAIAGVIGLGTLALPSLVDASKKRKNKKKIKRNDFGCVSVGKFCKNGGQCCSGICKGKKGKKKCKAHDRGGCQAGQSVPTCGGAEEVLCTTGAGVGGQCITTTGNAGYCYAVAACAECSKDADCEAICGEGAACFPCAVGCASKGGTACGGLTLSSCGTP